MADYFRLYADAALYLKIMVFKARARFRAKSRRRTR